MSHKIISPTRVTLQPFFFALKVLCFYFRTVSSGTQTDVSSIDLGNATLYSISLASIKIEKEGERMRSFLEHAYMLEQQPS